MNRTLAILALLFFHSAAITADVTDVTIPSDSDVPFGLEQLAEDTTLDYLAEFSARRRLTTFFANEQSPFYGVQINFVNVGKGNFTFLNRDLVRVDRMPIVFGRVYDSSITESSDFGPGWKLTVSEEIKRKGDVFTYTDSGNSVFFLKQKSSTLVADYPRLTGITAGSFHGHSIVLNFSSGLTKEFQRFGDLYKLTKVSNDNGSGITLNYIGGNLHSITSQNGGSVTIHRDDAGLIDSATDDHGRFVGFTYDTKGRLASFTDLGGGKWIYRYDNENNLISTADPRGMIILNASYANGKATGARILHDEMNFEYSGTNTKVSNSLNQEAIFWHHPSGLTEDVIGFGGDSTAIILDADLKPLSLDHNGSTVADFIYVDSDSTLGGDSTSLDVDIKPLSLDHNGSPVAEFIYGGSTLSGMVRRHNDGSVAERYIYENNKLAKVIRDDLVVARYAYDSFGRVLEADDVNGHRAYRYHHDGRLQSITHDGKLYEVQTNSIGQIEQVGTDDKPWIGISYNPEGSVSNIDRTFSGQSMPLRFEYDNRGFRIRTYFNENGAVATTYDAVGSISKISYPKDGGSVTDRYLVGENNELIEVIPEGKTGIRVEYDSVGRAINVARDSKTSLSSTINSVE